MTKDELIENHLSDLKIFVESKDTINSKSYLDNLPETLKGKVLEEFVALLYRGNGWIAELVGGRHDKGADILIRHPHEPTTVKFIIQTKNHKTPLNKKDTLAELNQFIDEGSKKYNCTQYRIISVNEFVEDAKPLQKYNLRLDGWYHITKLIKSFGKTENEEPEIGLHSHNKTTYDNLVNLWGENKRVAVIQATGTGKSFIIYKAFSDFIGKDKILLVPSNAILNQFKDNSDYSWLIDSKTKIFLYHHNENFKDENIENLKADLIVLDEFHRVGAKGFNIKIQKLLDHNPNAYVLGTSATPVRYLDNGRDMCEEIFEGVFASNLTLPQAIISNILPNPIYIASLISLEQDTEKIKTQITNSKKSEEEKTELTTEIDKIKLDWEKSSGAADILKKHLQGTDLNKFIVFCEGVDHLDKMIVEVESWFQKAGFRNRIKFQAHSKLSKKENTDSIEQFKNANQKDAVKLLFAVDMLNEGVHIPDVSGVILLRPTESPIVFYQQIGRCLQVGNPNPIIFDFVNNFTSIRARDFLNDLKDAQENERQQRKADGVSDDTPEFKITDESKDVVALFQNIQDILAPWEIRLQEFKDFVAKEGSSYVSKTNPETESLGVWCSDMRTLRTEDRLSPERIKKLDEAGFSWFPNDEKWETQFKTFIEFKARFNKVNVTKSDIKKYPEYYSLHHWLHLQKSIFSRGTYLKEREKRLTDEGVVLVSKYKHKTKEEVWYDNLEKLKAFKLLNGFCHPNQIDKDPETKKLAKWVNDQMHLRNNGRKNVNGEKFYLRKDREKILEELGIDWDWELNKAKAELEDGIKVYLAFRELFPNEKAPKGQAKKYNDVLEWKAQTRHRKYRFDQWKIDRLNEINFPWKEDENTNENEPTE